MHPPTVSVIMNCLNCAKYLLQALESLRTQTFQDFEIIFLDNCSTDESAAIARGYGPQLRYFRGEKTVPLGSARNRAIAQAKGQYIAFLDCDDLWRPTKLERQVSLFRDNTRLGLVCTDTEIFDGKRVISRLFAQTEPCRGLVYGELLQRQWIAMSSAMLSRQSLDSVLPGGRQAGDIPAYFDESLNVCEEADLFYRIAHDWEIDFIDRPLTQWRVHGANTTFRKFGQFADETMRILQRHREMYPEFYERHTELVALLTKRAVFQKAVALWRDGQNMEAREAIRNWRNSSNKYRLFWIASYLPGSFFDVAAKLYFALPARFRRVL